MLKIIKNFFNDNEKIVGLCALSKRGLLSGKEERCFYGEFNKNRFVPRIDKNILLI